jgi:nickel-dependent lactate racemase
MTTTVNFGIASACRLALGEHTVLAPNAGLYKLVADPAVAVRAALANPQHYPPLDAATVPGDHVTVAVDADVPCVATIVRGAIEALLDAGVDSALVTVVTALNADAHHQLMEDLKVAAPAISFERHEPDNEKAHAMIGSTSSGRPLRLNRTLVEADFVLPIAGTRLTTRGAAAPAKYAGLFPQFSNRETQNRFDSRRVASSPKKRAEERSEVNEAGWLLGVGMCIRVVAGPGGGISAVLAGDPETVARDAATQFREIWERPASQQGDLVIAALAGDEDEQTWDNLARALTASERVRLPDGAIAVCSNLAEPPAGSLNRLIEAIDLAAAQRDLRRDPAHDAHSARVLAQALERGPVYLKSRLPADIVESLGMTPIESDAELSRLAASRGHCIVIEEAQRLRPHFVAQPQ